MPVNQTVAVPTTSRLMVLSPNDVAFALNGGKKANTIDMGRTRFRGCRDFVTYQDKQNKVYRDRTKEWSLGCVIPAGAHFTQPRDQFFSRSL